MDKDIFRIKRRVSKVLYIYKIKDRELEQKLYFASVNKYETNVSNGVSNKEALSISFAFIDEFVCQNCKPPRLSRKYAFSLVISLLFLVAFVIIGIISSFSSSACIILLYTYISSIVFIVLTLIYALCTNSKRTWLDFVLLVIFLSIFIVLLFVIMPYCLLPKGWDFDREYVYYFPCVIKITRYINVAADDVLAVDPVFKAWRTKYMFEPTIIVMLVSSAFFAVLSIKDTKRISNVSRYNEETLINEVKEKEKEKNKDKTNDFE